MAGVLVASALGTNTAAAGPEGGQVVAGTGTITQTATTTLINQGSERIAIDWQSFNVGQNESVRFDQPSSSSIALNTIFDQNASQILGALDANGHVYLINPNGIVFGQNAQINVGALIASSLNLSLEDFQAGNLQFNANGAAGLVVNHGLIQAATGGSVTLLGGSVANEGVIVADLGQVTLGAGAQAALDFDGDGLLYFSIDGEALTDASGNAAVSNSGTIQANGGTVLLSGHAAQNVFSNVVNNDGVIRATRIENVGGVVRLVGDGAPVITSGTIDVSGGDAASTGGRIELLGDKVGVAAGASLLADGATGGGTILVGGDAHGGGGVPTADYTFVGAGAQLSANATAAGDGGKVVVWADQVARVYGDISARGGAVSGDGGFIETSGKKFLDFDGSVNAGAPNGRGGTWLLDPEDVIITNANNNITQAGGGDPGTVTFTPTADDTTTMIDVDDINAALDAGSDVSITTASGGTTTAGNITVNADINKQADGGQGDGSTLTLTADNNIVVNNSISSIADVLNVNLSANGSVQVNAAIDANGGTITIVVDADEATANGAESLTIGSTLTAAAINLDGVANQQDDSLILQRGGGDTATWTVTAANGGTLAATGSTSAAFNNFASLVGGAQADTFDINVAFAGDVNGNAGTDTLDLAGFATARNIMLTSAGANGFSGTEASVSGNFQNIDTIVGGAGTDRVTGFNAASTWSIDGTNTYASGGNTLAFSSLEDLVGGTGDDTFDVDVAHTGSVDGNAGADVLDLGGFATARNIALTAGTADGFAGTEASLSTGFLDIDTIVGGAGTDSITGLNATATWALDGTPTYTSGGNTLAFSAIENLGGGSGADTFDVDAAFTGSVDGNAGADGLDLSGLAGARNVVLTAGAANGFAGTETSLTAGFADIDSVVGGAGTDSLTGLNAAATWSLGTLTYASGGNTLAFTSFESLAGGSAADTFVVDPAFTGTIDGNAGADVLDLTGTGVANVTLTAGVANGFAGTDGVTGGFSDIDSLVASGAGTDTLTGLNATATWGLDGTNTYTSGGNTVAFSSFENLVGGTGADTFDVDATFTGNVDGNTGTDVLDLGGFATARNIVLTAGVADGFAGTEASVTGGFADIDTIIGGTGTDSLTGLNAISTWGLDGTPTYASGGNTLNFSAIENLVGNAAADTFDVDAAFTGSVDGNAGADVLDLGGFATARTIQLTAGTANGFAGTETSLSAGFADIDTIVGGTGTDSITGLSATATWGIDGTNTYTSGGNTLAFSALENLLGGAGADTFDIDVAFTGSVDGNAGTDQLDLSAFATARNITLTVSGGNGFSGTEAAVSGGFADIDDIVSGTGNDTLTGLAAQANWVIDGTNTYENAVNGNILAFSGVENLTGGGDNDTFDFSVAFAGNVAGSGGNDVFNFLTGAALAGAVTGGAGDDAFNFNGGDLTGTGQGGDGDDSFRLNDPASTVTGTLDAGETGETLGDRLIGSPINDTFTITGVAAVLSNGSGGTLNVDNIENLGGGDGDDTFDVNNAFAGNIDGDAGIDVLDLTDIATQQTVTLTSASADGFTGTETSVAGGFADIDDIRTGAAANDLLVGLNAAATWSIDGTNTYTSGGRTLAFSGIENATGGTGADVFDLLTGGTLGVVVGGDGDDEFNFNGGNVTVSASGGNGDDTFRLVDVNTVVTATLDAGAGGETLGDTIAGPAAASTFAVTTAGNVTLTVDGAAPGSMTVTGVENATGGAGADTFAFSAAGDLTRVVSGGGGDDTFDLDVAITGSIDGNAGADVLDLTTLGTARAVTLTAGSATGFAGTEAAVGGGFANVDDIRAGAAATDSLTGLDAAATFGLDGTNTYTSGGNTLAFAGFENLVGGSGADTFDVDATHTGTIDGNGGADVLDLTTLGTARAVVLTSANGDGFAGTEASVSNGFTDIDDIRAGASTGDSLTGLNVNATFVLDGSNTYTACCSTLAFAGFENLVGGSGNDTFDVDATHTGTIDGNGGTDVLDLTTLVAARAVVLTAGTANGFAGTDTAVSGGFADIDDIRAGASTSDSLTGLNAAATFGLDGTNTYTSGGNTVAFAGFETLNGGTEVDTFDVSAASIGGTLNGGLGDDQFNVTASASAAMNGGGGNDTFTLADGVVAGGILDGGAGTGDILDLTAYAAARNVQLTGVDADGFAGTDASASFAHIDDIRAGASTSDSLTGLNAAATFGLDGTNTYASGGNTLAFAGFENLAGGSGADTFDVDATHTGTIDGNGGADVLDLTSLAMARAVTLTAGAATGFAGTDASVSGGFVDIDEIRAGNSTSDSLTGLNAAATFGLDGTNTYTSGGNTLAFAGFENLAGGSGADTFDVDATHTGTIDGNGGADVLDLTSLATARAVTLTAGAATGFAGTDASVSGGFVDIDDIRAGASTSDSLTGLNAPGTFNVGGTNTYTSGTNTLAFAGFENLTGGSANDAFNLAGNQAGAITLVGGGGTDAATITGAFSVQSLTTDVETVTSSTAAAVVTATGALTINNASGGIGTASQPLMTNVASLLVTGAATRVSINEANALTVTGVATTSGNIDIRLLGAGDLIIGRLNAGPPSKSSGNVNLQTAAGNILNVTSGSTGVSGGSATFVANGIVGTEASRIVLDLAADGLITILTPAGFAAPAVSRPNFTPLAEGTIVNDDDVTRGFVNSLATSTQSAVQDTAAIDWAALDPNIAIVDCREPCVALPADQAEEEGLAELREATKLLLIRTSEGWKLIPVFPLDTTAAVRE